LDLFRSRVLILAVAVAAAIAFGTAGFMLIEHFTLLEAVYMATMTVTTIGYREVRPLSQAGRIFNTMFMLVGSGTLLIGTGVITATIFEFQLEELFRKRRTRRMITNLNNHVIICGLGRVGRGAAAELKRAGVSFVVVDSSDERVEWAMKQGMLAVVADATRDETLRDVGIDRARGLIASLASDADNLFLTLSAKQLNPAVMVSSRVNEDEAESKLRRAGADSVFAPYNFTGLRLAQSVMRPHVTQFLDFTTQSVGLNVAIEQVRVAESSQVVSKSLRELSHIRKELGVSVLAIRRADGRMTVNPGADETISAGDFLIVMGAPQSLQQLEKLFAQPGD
jgi:voltage-gated potassium channel